MPLPFVWSSDFPPFHCFHLLLPTVLYLSFSSSRPLLNLTIYLVPSLIFSLLVLQEEDSLQISLSVLEPFDFLHLLTSTLLCCFPTWSPLRLAFAIMDLDLLVCSICPKKPSFSDTSHLLTHVGSKGHLSHLHKLQVRSHQEIEAGVQLATYNQWYQHHGLAQLLSERMVMKETKKAGRRKAATSRGAYVTERVSKDQTLSSQALPQKRIAKGRIQSQKKTRGRRGKPTADDDSDFEYSPVKRPRYVALHSPQ